MSSFLVHHHPPRGFTLVELLMVVAIIGMLAILTVQQFAEDRDALRNRTLAANLDVIQTAIERYHTDSGQYPLFLLGGDLNGWRLWHATYDESKPDPTHPQNAWLHDPLIAGGYLTSYPENPFVDDGGKAMLLQTSRPGQAMGDPRFGLLGNVAGNGVDDPRVFRNWFDDDRLGAETRRTQIASGVPLDDLVPYAMGGRRIRQSDHSFEMTPTWWPGNFLYRAYEEHLICRKCWSIYYPGMYQNTGVGGYILGMYGNYRQTGKDVVRLETLDPTGQKLYYAPLPPWRAHRTEGDYDMLTFGLRNSDRLLGQGGYPELMGGGSAWEGPVFPYNRDHDFPNVPQFGSSDGVPDGVVHVVAVSPS